MAGYQLALIVKSPHADSFQFLVTRQKRPSPEKFDGLPHVDKELWDLPSARLSPMAGNSTTMSPHLEDEDGSIDEVARIVTSSIKKLGLKGFKVVDAIAQIQAQVIPNGVKLKSWRYWKLVEESDFGPGPALHTVIFMTDQLIDPTQVSGGEWLDSQTTMDMLVQAGTHERRIGPLAALTASTHVPDGLVADFESISGQEYPPGVVVLPMRSQCPKPFGRTNLVIFSPSHLSGKGQTTSSGQAASGDVLICDPGCIGAAQTELAHIVKTLPRKLVVFLTHHHYDHIDGLPVVKRNNPEALIVAHEATLRRMGKAAKGFNCIAVEGGSKLLIAGHELEVVSAPGHTDGHLAIYDAATGSLVVGDHCLGQGSSLLDPDSGGNLQDFMETTWRLLEIKPHFLVPMHGRPNLWPAHMLNGYIKHREAREAQVLKEIEGGARTAYQIVSGVHIDTPIRLWPYALRNVRLHVEHLHQQQQLPQNFSLDDFYRSSETPFMLRYLHATAKNTLWVPWVLIKSNPATSVLSSASVVVLLGAIAFFWVQGKVY